MAKVDQLMENKFILELIKKDIEELKLLVDSILEKENPEQLLIDISKAKAKTLLQEFDLLKASEINTFEETQPVKETVTSRIEEVEEKKNEEIIEKESVVLEEIIEDKTTDILIEEKQEHERKVEIIEEELKIEPKEEEAAVEKEIKIEETPQVIKENEVKIEEKLEDTSASVVEETAPEKKVLGEQFIKEPSLNDRLSETKIESKIKAQPIKDLKAAIGLNDRFMYTRELFNNKQELFLSTVEAIDKAEGLNAAIEYLDKNFTWPKNDVSLKFIELIKRRFEN